MAKVNPEENTSEQTITMTPAQLQEQFAIMLGNAVADGMAKHSPKKQTFGEYQRKINAGRSKLTRQCFENGLLMHEEVLSNLEIDLLNKLDRSGRYLNRLVEVVISNEGADQSVELRYNCRTRDQMFALRGEAKSLEDMLLQIVDLQAGERAMAKG